MKNYKSLILVGLLFCVVVPVQAQRMGPFCSFSINNDGSGNFTIGPYIGTVKYFDYFEKGNTADDTLFHKNKYYFYFNLTETTNEIGARALSPVPITVMPNRGDQVTMNYFENESNREDYFDPVIILEKCVVDDAGEKKWIVLGENDNSEELPAQPSGERKNALIRVASDTSDASKMLYPGLYRIVVMDKNDGPAIGTCFLQVGTTSQVAGLRLYKDPAELQN